MSPPDSVPGRRPRVVHVYKDAWPPVEGGIERAIHHMADLARPEFDTAIVVAAPGRRRGGTREIAGGVHGGVPVREVASAGRALSTPLAPGFVNAILESRADLLHFHFPHPTGELAYLVARARGLRTPAVVTYHSDVVRQRIALLAWSPFQHAFLRRMRVVMPTSRRYLESSATLAPHADRCRVVPLGMPLERYRLDDAGRARVEEMRARWGDFVLFLGCLRYYKGLHDLIDAARALMPTTHFVIAGEGKEGPALRRRARAAGLIGRADGRASEGDTIHFLGRVDDPTAIALLHAAAVFCLPACERSEAFGLCQIEALACGLPVVSTDLPTGVPEINRDQETGWIVPPRAPLALGKALMALLRDPEMRARMGEAGRRRAEEHYRAETMVERVMAIYREVLGGTNGEE